MKIILPRLLTLCLFSLCAFAQNAPSPEENSQGIIPDLDAPKPPRIISTELIDWHVARRGENFAVREKIQKFTLEDGSSSSSTNRYTVLGNGMHYFEDGEWKESEDVIEVFPGGAVVRKGPNRTIFSPDLNAEAVFDMETSAGDRIRGGVRSIQITDAATGFSRVIAEVKQNAPGELLPPNRIVYRDAFDGLKADVVYVWKHNLFSQNVIFLERPEIPQGIDPEYARLEVVTEFAEAPQPEVKRKFRLKDDVEIIDDAMIQFGNLLVVPGKALPTQEGGFSLDSPSFLNKDGIHVAKEWLAVPDGRRFLIESVDWEESEPEFRELPPARQASDFTPSRIRKTADAFRPLPEKFSKRPEFPMEVASLDYQPRGFLVDVTTLPSSASSYTFETGETYLVDNNFYVGDGTITFEKGSVIKSTPNDYFLTYGPLSFPGGTLENVEKVIFTSKDDDSFGEKIPGSDGEPNYHADPALMVYYVDFANSIYNAWFRWAQNGVEFYTNQSDDPVHEIYDCFFQHCETAIYTDTYSEVDVGDSEQCEVIDPEGGSENVNGSLSDADDCLEIRFSAFNNLNSPFEDYADSSVPDSMGAAGPSNYIEIVNSGIALFDKSSGELLELDSLKNFFNGSTTDIFDPRIIYDFGCNKWIASAMERSADKIYFAISKTNSPSDLSSTNWANYSKSVGTNDIDFPTLGVDGNGVYLVVNHLVLHGGKDVFAPDKTLLAISKSATTNLNHTAMDASDIQLLSFNMPDDMYNVTIQPAVNFDNISSSDPAWFIAKGQPVTNAYSPGKIHSFRLNWSGSTPSINTDAWDSPYVPNTSYYDLDLDSDFAPPQNGGNENIYMTGSPLSMSLIQNNYLWTCHHVGLDGTDVNYGGNQTNTIDRTGIQVFKFSVGATNLTYSTSSMIYDNVNSTAAYHYFFPSMMINDDGAGLIGFSGGQEDIYYGAYYSSKLDTGGFTTPKLIISGENQFTQGRWGDYSYTSIDPSDTKYIWTVQEYALLWEAVPEAHAFYSTVIVKIKINY